MMYGDREGWDCKRSGTGKGKKTGLKGNAYYLRAKQEGAC